MSGLAGKRVLVTRPRQQAASLATLLRKAGAKPLMLPLIEMVPPADMAALDRAARAAAGYDWIIFTSANAVAAFYERRQQLGLPRPVPARCAAIGPATAMALRARGQTADLVPAEFVAEAFAAELNDVEGQRFLLPRAENGREYLAVYLRLRGAQVDEVAAYRTLPAEFDAEALAELERGVDIVTLTSASTARGFAALAADLPKALIACLGPKTAEAAREAGLPVHITAAVHTTGGLLAAIEAYLSLEVI